MTDLEIAAIEYVQARHAFARARNLKENEWTGVKAARFDLDEAWVRLESLTEETKADSHE